MDGTTTVAKTKAKWIFQPVITVAASVILLLALTDMDDAFYSFLRIAITAYAGVLTYRHFKANNQVMGSVAAVIAILFNPAFPIEMSKDSWQLADAAAAAMVWVINLTNFIEVRDAFFAYYKKYRIQLVITAILVGIVIFVEDPTKRQVTEAQQKQLLEAYQPVEDFGAYGVEVSEAKKAAVDLPQNQIETAAVDDLAVWRAIRGYINQPVFWESLGSWITLSPDPLLQHIRNEVGNSPFKASIWARHPLPYKLDGKERTLYIIKSVPSKGKYDCHVCAPLIGAYILRSESGGFVVEAGNPYFMEVGKYGDYDQVANLKMHDVGEDAWVVELPLDDLNMGIESSGFSLLGYRKGKFYDMGHVILGVDESGRCAEEGPKDCSVATAEYSYVDGPGPFKDIKVTRTITKSSDKGTLEEVFRVKNPDNPQYLAIEG